MNRLLSIIVFSVLVIPTNSLAQEKIRIGYIGLSLSSLPLLAARELGFFAKNGIQAEVLLLTFQLSSIAMSNGELDYVAGVGPGTVSATLGGNPLRAVWIVADRLIYNVMAQPELKTLQDLRGKRIGVAGLGATTHTAFTMAVEKAGANPKDFIVVGLGPQQQQRALESKAIDAVMIDPPVLFVLQKKGFSKVLDIGSLVEMPVGGLTTLSKTIGGETGPSAAGDQSAARGQGNFNWLQGKIGRVHRQDDENGSAKRRSKPRDYGLCLGRQRRADAPVGIEQHRERNSIAGALRRAQGCV